MLKHYLRNLLIGLAFVSLAPSAFAAETFVFTAIPDQDEARLQERFGKVATYLSKELGVEAGQSLDQAIVRVARELHTSCPPLAHEFEIVAYEMKRDER